MKIQKKIGYFIIKQDFKSKHYKKIIKIFKNNKYHKNKMKKKLQLVNK